jgi:hypothetical protein
VCLNADPIAGRGIWNAVIHAAGFHTPGFRETDSETPEELRAEIRRQPRSGVRSRHLLTAGGLAMGCIVLMLWLGTASAAQPPLDVRVSVQWDQESSVSESESSSVTLIPYPFIRKGRPLHEPVMAALKSLNARHHRLLPYCTHPQLSIAALHPPTKHRTSWDFSLIDPEVIAFLEATKGREPILNFGPIPLWMFKGGDTVVYTSDPDEVDWPKCGSQLPASVLIDPTGKQVAEYFARIASWYTRGGFTDELGHYHHSGYHYELPWWGVLNEPDFEHAFTPEQYTRLYDAVVAALRKVSPATKFRGMEIAYRDPHFVEYFLDPHNHAAGTPIDMASIHGFAVPSIGESIDSWQYTVFDQLSVLVKSMAYIDAIRKRLSPQTRISVGELGVGLPEDGFAVSGAKPVDTTKQTPTLWWNLAAAFHAVAFIELSKNGADVISTAHFIGYPPQMMPSIGVIDSDSGKPQAAFHVLKLLRKHLSVSRTWVQTSTTYAAGSARGIPTGDIAAQAFRTDQGRKLLLVNKRNRTVNVAIESVRPMSSSETIDESGVTQSAHIDNEAMSAVGLQPFAVSMIAFSDDERDPKDKE